MFCNAHLDYEIKHLERKSALPYTTGVPKSDRGVSITVSLVHTKCVKNQKIKCVF